MDETDTEREKKRNKRKKNVDIQQVHAERGISYLQFWAVHKAIKKNSQKVFIILHDITSFKGKFYCIDFESIRSEIYFWCLCRVYWNEWKCDGTGVSKRANERAASGWVGGWVRERTNDASGRYRWTIIHIRVSKVSIGLSSMFQYSRKTTFLGRFQASHFFLSISLSLVPWCTQSNELSKRQLHHIHIQEKQTKNARTNGEYDGILESIFVVLLEVIKLIWYLIGRLKNGENAICGLIHLAMQLYFIRDQFKWEGEEETEPSLFKESFECGDGDGGGSAPPWNELSLYVSN